MSRKKIKRREEALPDAVYNDRLLGKMINVVMESGKRNVAERICYGALDIMESKGNPQPIKLFKKAIDNVKPSVEVKSRRVGGSSYQVPIDIRPVRRIALALRWIVDAAEKREGRSMAEKLSEELMSAANETGGAFKKKEEVHRMADANRAFAHYRW